MAVPDKLTAATVKAWAETLPYANRALLARETFELIERLPEADLVDRQKLLVVESIKRPVSAVLDHIRHRLVVDDAGSEQFLALGDAYCQRLTTLCTSLSGGADKPGRVSSLLPLASRPSKQALTLSGHFLEQWYLLRALNYHGVPAGFWGHVRSLAGQHRGAKIASLARLLALHLAGPAAMTQQQAHAVVAMLRSLPMATLVVIGDAAARAGEPGFYLADDDVAPAFGVPPQGALVVDLAPLVAAVQAKSNGEVVLALLPELLSRWQGARPEKAVRRPTGRAIRARIIIGLRGVVRHLAPPAPPAPPVSTSAGGGLAAGGPREMVGQTEAGHAFGDGKNPFAAPAEPVQASFLDISPGGCRLRTRWDAVQVGDIVAVYWGCVEWRIGCLAWIRRHADEWECGVQWLLRQPRAVKVRFDSSEPVVGLVGESYSDGREGLIYAAGASAGHQECEVSSGDGWVSMRLQAEKTTAVVELALLARPEELVSAPPPTSAPAPSVVHAHDDNDDLWDVLTAIGAIPN